MRWPPARCRAGVRVAVAPRAHRRTGRGPRGRPTASSSSTPAARAEPGEVRVRELAPDAGLPFRRWRTSSTRASCSPGATTLYGRAARAWLVSAAGESFDYASYRLGAVRVGRAALDAGAHAPPDRARAARLLMGAAARGLIGHPPPDCRRPVVSARRASR
ncbi:MAG: hypothetical protein MZV65_18570 [Chromatiales bacterium]|nr:hypothetical protein [Chromatiales bacterium]